VRETLQSLARVPGVVGSLALGTGGELLASTFPEPFADGTLREVAALLGEDASGIGKLVGPGGSLDLGYAGGRAVVRPFGHGTLLVLCAPSINAVLLGMSVEHAARRLERTGSAPAGPPARPATPAAPASPPPAEVAAARGALGTALMRQIGPIGEVVAGEAWARWTAAGPASRARLGELVGALAREIDDEAGRAAFLAEAAAIAR
jgi:hypothetical protein